MSASLPRPVLMLLVGVVAIAGIFLFSHRGGSNNADTSAPSAPSSAPTTSAPSSAAPSTADKAGAPSVQSRPRGHASASKRADQPRTLPGPVKRALDAHRVVVLLFWNPRGVDDRSVRKAVAGVSGRGGKVAVFTDRLKHLARYTRITAAANVVQTPTLIVVDRRGQAQVATGYMDKVSVDQHVVDALHGK